MIDPRKLDEFFASTSWEKSEELPGLVAALLVEREEMLALMRESEWVPDSDGDLVCRACRQSVISGHAPDCRLAAFLKPDARTVPK